MVRVCLAVAVVAVAALLPPPAASTLIDLSYTFNKDAPHSPKMPRPFQHDIIKKGFNTLGLWQEVYEFCTSEHSGTHLDAPSHNAKSGWSLEDIPIELLWRRKGVVVDVGRAINASRNYNYVVRPADLISWERTHGIIPDGAVLLVRTGWSRKVGGPARGMDSYSGLDSHNKLNFPGLSEEAAKWIVDHKKRNKHKEGIVAVGIDTLSLDKGQSTKFPVHVTLFTHNIYGLENLANLDKLPETGFYITSLPVKIGGGSGAPVRVVAEMGDMVTMHSLSDPRPASCLALLLAMVASTWLLTL